MLPESVVTNLIYQVNGLLPEYIRRSDSLINDLEMDSIEVIDLLMRLEELGIIIRESDVNSSLTVDDIINLMQVMD